MALSKEKAFQQEYESLLAGNPIKEKPSDISLHDYLDRLLRYLQRNKSTAFKKGDLSVLKKWKKFPIAVKMSSEISHQDFIDHFEMRITQNGVAPATSHRDLVPLVNALEWQERIKTPFNNVITPDLRKRLFKQELTGKSRHRDYRPTFDQYITLYKHCLKRDHHHLSEIKYRHMMLFAIYSTFRCDEICSLTWSNFNEKTGRIIIEDRKDPNNKYGNHYNIPLHDECIAIINMQKKVEGEDRIFPYDAHSVSSKFCKMTNDELDLRDVTFHSLRHDGISRLFEQGYTIPQVAIHSSHKSWENLKRYTHLHQAEVPDVFSACIALEKEFKDELIKKVLEG